VTASKPEKKASAKTVARKEVAAKRREQRQRQKDGIDAPGDKFEE